MPYRWYTEHPTCHQGADPRSCRQVLGVVGFILEAAGDGHLNRSKDHDPVPNIWLQLRNVGKSGLPSVPSLKSVKREARRPGGWGSVGRGGDGFEAEVFADGGEDVLAGDGGASEVVEAQADILVAIAAAAAAGGAAGEAGRDGPSCGSRGSVPSIHISGRVAYTWRSYLPARAVIPASFARTAAESSVSSSTVFSSVATDSNNICTCAESSLLL